MPDLMWKEDRGLRPHRVRDGFRHPDHGARVERVDVRYRLSGHKRRITNNGHAASMRLVFAPGGIAAFVVGMDEAKLSLAEYAEKRGILSAPTDDALPDGAFGHEESGAGEKGKGRSAIAAVVHTSCAKRHRPHGYLTMPTNL